MKITVKVFVEHEMLTNPTSLPACDLDRNIKGNIAMQIAKGILENLKITKVPVIGGVEYRCSFEYENK